MKKRERSVEVADLDAVAHFEEDLVLFIDNEDQNIPATLCVRANFDTQQFGPVQPMAVYLESNAYHPIEDGETQMSYRQRIHEEMKPDTIAAMLSEFTQKRWPDLTNPSFKSDNHPRWLPGG